MTDVFHQDSESHHELLMFYISQWRQMASILPIFMTLQMETINHLSTSQVTLKEKSGGAATRVFDKHASRDAHLTRPYPHKWASYRERCDGWDGKFVRRHFALCSTTSLATNSMFGNAGGGYRQVMEKAV